MSRSSRESSSPSNCSDGERSQRDDDEHGSGSISQKHSRLSIGISRCDSNESGFKLPGSGSSTSQIVSTPSTISCRGTSGSDSVEYFVNRDHDVRVENHSESAEIRKYPTAPLSNSTLGVGSKSPDHNQYVTYQYLNKPTAFDAVESVSSNTSCHLNDNIHQKSKRSVRGSKNVKVVSPHLYSSDTTQVNSRSSLNDSCNIVNSNKPTSVEEVTHSSPRTPRQCKICSDLDSTLADNSQKTCGYDIPYSNKRNDEAIQMEPLSDNKSTSQLNEKQELSKIPRNLTERSNKCMVNDSDEKIDICDKKENVNNTSCLKNNLCVCPQCCDARSGKPSVAVHIIPRPRPDRTHSDFVELPLRDRHDYIVQDVQSNLDSTLRFSTERNRASRQASENILKTSNSDISDNRLSNDCIPDVTPTEGCRGKTLSAYKGALSEKQNFSTEILESVDHDLKQSPSDINSGSLRPRVSYTIFPYESELFKKARKMPQVAHDNGSDEIACPWPSWVDKIRLNDANNFGGDSFHEEDDFGPSVSTSDHSRNSEDFVLNHTNLLENVNNRRASSEQELDRDFEKVNNNCHSHKSSFCMNSFQNRDEEFALFELDPNLHRLENTNVGESQTIPGHPIDKGVSSASANMKNASLSLSRETNSSVEDRTSCGSLYNNKERKQESPNGTRSISPKSKIEVHSGDCTGYKTNAKKMHSLEFKENDVADFSGEEMVIFNSKFVQEPAVSFTPSMSISKNDENSSEGEKMDCNKIQIFDPLNCNCGNKCCTYKCYHERSTEPENSNKSLSSRILAEMNENCIDETCTENTFECTTTERNCSPYFCGTFCCSPIQENTNEAVSERVSDSRSSRMSSDDEAELSKYKSDVPSCACIQTEINEHSSNRQLLNNNNTSNQNECFDDKESNSSDDSTSETASNCQDQMEEDEPNDIEGTNSINDFNETVASQEQQQVDTSNQPCTSSCICSSDYKNQCHGSSSALDNVASIPKGRKSNTVSQKKNSCARQDTDNLVSMDSCPNETKKICKSKNSKLVKAKHSCASSHKGVSSDQGRLKNISSICVSSDEDSFGEPLEGMDNKTNEMCSETYDDDFNEPCGSSRHSLDCRSETDSRSDNRMAALNSDKGSYTIVNDDLTQSRVSRKSRNTAEIITSNKKCDRDRKSISKGQTCNDKLAPNQKRDKCDDHQEHQKKRNSNCTKLSKQGNAVDEVSESCERMKSQRQTIQLEDDCTSKQSTSVCSDTSASVTKTSSSDLDSNCEWKLSHIPVSNCQYADFNFDEQEIQESELCSPICDDIDSFQKTSRISIDKLGDDKIKSRDKSCSSRGKEKQDSVNSHTDRNKVKCDKIGKRDEIQDCSRRKCNKKAKLEDIPDCSTQDDNSEASDVFDPETSSKLMSPCRSNGQKPVCYRIVSVDMSQKSKNENKPSFVNQRSYCSKMVELGLDVEGPDFAKDFSELMQRIKDDEGFSENDLEGIIWFLWHQREEAFCRITEWERSLQSMSLCSGSVEHSLKMMQEESSSAQKEITDCKDLLSDCQRGKDSLELQMSNHIEELMNTKCMCLKQIAELKEKNETLQNELKSLNKSSENCGCSVRELDCRKTQNDKLQSEMADLKLEIINLTRLNEALKLELTHQQPNKSECKPHSSDMSDVAKETSKQSWQKEKEKMHQTLSELENGSSEFIKKCAASSKSYEPSNTAGREQEIRNSIQQIQGPEVLMQQFSTNNQI